MYIATYMSFKHCKVTSNIYVVDLLSRLYNYIICCNFVFVVFIAQFNASEYEFDINIYSPIGTVVFEALFIINPNVTVDFLSFDIIMTDEIVGESSIDGDFLINGTMLPLLIQAPYQSMYLLTITTGNALDTNDTMDITFNLLACFNTLINVMGTSISNVTLHKIGKAST